MIQVNNKIRKRLQECAPKVKDSEAFMADTIRQIDLMPSPSSELQESLRRYTWMERLSMRLDAARWLMIGGTSTAVVGYAVLTNYEIILSAIYSLLRLL